MTAPTKTGSIAAEMRRMITSGEVRPGAFMPTEAWFAAKFEVAKATIKAATAKLVNEGLLERVPGNRGGMRVRERVVITHYRARAELPYRPFSESDAYFAEVRQQGFEPTQEFDCRIVALPAELAQRLELEEGDAAVLRRCVRSVNGKPTSIQSTYYPKWLADQVPELMSPTDIAIGTTQLLRERGFDQVAWVDEYMARMPTPDETIELEFTGGGNAILDAVRVGYTMDATVRVTVEAFAGDSNRMLATHGNPQALERAAERAG